MGKTSTLERMYACMIQGEGEDKQDGFGKEEDEWVAWLIRLRQYHVKVREEVMDKLFTALAGR